MNAAMNDKSAEREQRCILGIIHTIRGAVHRVPTASPYISNHTLNA